MVNMHMSCRPPELGEMSPDQILKCCWYKYYVTEFLLHFFSAIAILLLCVKCVSIILYAW